MKLENILVRLTYGCLILIGLCIIALIFCFVMLKKNDNTYTMHMKIVNAICNYQLQCISNKETYKVNYNDMESYDRTMFRLWDWGYTHILPKEKFEIIKPYIKE